MRGNDRKPSKTRRRAASEQRALLVEIVNADQFPGRINYGFPFFRGYLAERGIPTRWIRFGVSTINQLKHGRDRITLGEGELAQLLDIARSHRPTFILLTDKLHARQMELLAEHAPGARITIDRRGSLSRKPPEMKGYKNNFLELDRPGFLPLYDWEAGNREAETKEIDNIYLALAGSCGHTARVAANPIYSGIDDPRVNERPGCAFCENWIDNNPYISRTGEEWIRKQIRGIALSRGTAERLPNGLLFERLESVNALNVCIQAMEEYGMTGRVRILIAARANQAQALERCLEQHFERNPTSAAKFGVYASGFESFSDEELLFFNKGIKPLDCLRALRIFRGLKKRLPDNFTYSGITFILFTPWTTLENLHLNFGLIRFLGMTRQEAGNVFQSRLRLHPQLSITALAERENLITDRETDPVLIMNRRKLFGSERPWKFKDARLRPISRVVLRYDLLESGIMDRLLGKIRKRFEAAGFDWKTGGGDNLLDFTLCMIDAVRRGTGVPDEETLVDRALELWKERDSRYTAARGKNRLRRLGRCAVDLARLTGKLASLAKNDLKPVFSVEDVGKEEYSNGISDLLKGMGLKSEFVARAQSLPRRGILYVSSDEDKLRRILDLQDEIRESEQPEEKKGAIEEAGILFGYPKCCARAFAQDPAYSKGFLPLICFEKRTAVHGAVSPLFNPFLTPDISFVPCSHDCAEAIGLFRRWFEELGIGVPSGSEDDTAYIFPLDGDYDGDLVELAVKESGDRMRYEITGAELWDEELLASLHAGNTIEVIPGQIRIHDGERLVDFITATHGLWYSRTCPHADEWHEIAKIRLTLASKVDSVHQYGYALQVSFNDKTGGSSEYRFNIAEFHPGDRVYKAVNSKGLVHLPCETDGNFAALAEILVAVMMEIDEPPNGRNFALWENAVKRKFSASPLAKKFICEVKL